MQSNEIFFRVISEKTYCMLKSQQTFVIVVKKKIGAGKRFHFFNLRGDVIDKSYLLIADLFRFDVFVLRASDFLRTLCDKFFFVPSMN